MSLVVPAPVELLRELDTQEARVQPNGYGSFTTHAADQSTPAFVVDRADTSAS
jgi:hypothetical protein